MSDKSLAYRLGIYISSAVLFVFVVFMILLFRFHLENRKNSNEDKAKLINSEIFRNVRESIIQTEIISKDISRQIGFYLEHEGMEFLLSGVLEEYEFLESVEIRLNNTFSGKSDSVYFSFLNEGKLVYTEGNPENPIYKEDFLSDAKTQSWSEPFRSLLDNSIISVFNYPFEFNNNIRNAYISGCIRCIVSIEHFRDIINEIKIWDTGYAFLVSQKGTYMTYPMREFELKRNIYDVFRDQKIVNDSSLVDEFMKGESGPLIVYPPVLNFKKAWSFPTKIDENGWLLVFTVPFSEFYQNIFSLLITMSVILLLVVIAIFFLVFYISRKVTKPLTRISKELHSFSIEILDQKPDSKNEMVALQKSLERLQARYEKHKQHEAEVTSRGFEIHSDLILASEIQQSIIRPTGKYSLPNSNISIQTVFRPARYVSGDLYDFFMIDEKRLLITMGDVSGGGIPAALFMGVAHTYIRSNASLKTSKEIVSQVNKQLCKNNSNQFFLTLFLGILDISNATLNYCNAGHSPTILYSGNDLIRELSDQHGLPLGLYPEKDYGETVVSVQKGDCLVLYTDGITDHINDAGEFYGVGAFINLLRQMKEITPEALVTLIMESVDSFGKGVSQHDDLSLMVVKYG